MTNSIQTGRATAPATEHRIPVRPSSADNRDVLLVLFKLGVKTEAREFKFFKSDAPALQALAERAGRVAERTVHRPTEGVEREISFLVATGAENHILGVAVSYAFGGLFQSQTTVVVDPKTMRADYL